MPVAFRLPLDIFYARGPSSPPAHWIIADLAVWMAGHVSVPLYPNLTADSVARVLEHSEAALVFIGKLDDWPDMAVGVRADLPTINLPLHPLGTFAYSWADLQKSSPIQDDPTPSADHRQAGRP